MSMVRISDISKAVHVSPATVARVVHNNGYVSDEKRKVIAQAIKDLGYVPNRVARGLRNQKTNYVGHVLPLSSVNPFFTRIGTAFHVAAEAAGYHVLTVVSQGNAEKERMMIEDLVGLMVEAIVFTAQTSCSTDVIRWVLSRGIPVIMIERPRDISNIDVVLLDSYEGSRLAIEHLISNGHRKIAFIGSKPEKHFVESQRYNGFTATMSQHDLKTPDHWIKLMYDYTVECGYSAMESILGSGDIPTSVFAASDLLACGVLQCLYQHGLRVPHDMSLVGYDNTLADLSVPALTSIELQPDQVGKSAIDLILERKKGFRIGAKTVTLIPRLVDRGSVAQI